VLSEAGLPSVVSAHSATAFTALVGCDLPIQQAGMGGAATADLVVAVAEAGALGMLGMPMVPLDAFSRTLDDIGARTRAPFGVNFLVPFLDRDAVALAARRARVVEFFYGDPDPGLVQLVHHGGALACWQVGSPDEASAAAEAGCDLVVAQGVEAGGHVRGETGLASLLEEVLDRVEVPVVAAGGIGTAEAVGSVIEAGASAARVGTRFLAADEADVHAEYVDALLRAEADDTILTTAFSLGWPDAPHRVLRSCVEDAEQLGVGIVGETDLGAGVTVPVPRFATMPPTRSTTGRISAMALYAGRSVADVRTREPAAAIVDELAGELTSP